MILTDWDVQRRAAAAQNAIESTSESEKATLTTADRVGVAARNDLTVTACCVASGTNSRPAPLYVSRWHGHSRKCDTEDSEDGWDLHFDGVDVRYIGAQRRILEGEI